MSRKLRIGYVVKRFPRVSETFIAQEVLELERHGAEVQILALSENDAPADHAWLRELRAPVRNVSNWSGDPWDELCRRHQQTGGGRGVRRALATLLDCPPDRARRRLAQGVAIAQISDRDQLDHLHAHFANSPADVALLAHHLSATPFSFTAHAKDIWTNPAGPAQWRRLVRHAEFAVTVSEATRGHLAELVGVRLAPKIRHLYNGVDLRRLHPVGVRRAPGSVPRLLCVARLIEKKGIDVLLDACVLLMRAGVAFEVVVIGDGPLADQLRCRRDALGLENHVDFRGAAAHEEVVGQLHRSAVFVLPCRVAGDGDRDTLPTVLLEAMACGVACVSTHVGGVPEIVEDGVTGRIVPPGNPGQLAAALMPLLQGPMVCEQMGRRGRQRAEQLFDRTRTVARLYDWFSASAAGPKLRRVAGASP